MVGWFWGCHYLLDWTTGLDYWTGLLDSKFKHKISFPCSHNYHFVSPLLKQFPWHLEQLFIWASGHLSIVATPQQGCNREVACVTLSFSVAKHWIGGLIIQVNIWLHRMVH